MSEQSAPKLWVQPYFWLPTPEKDLRISPHPEDNAYHTDIDIIVAADDAPEFVKPIDCLARCSSQQITWDVKDGVGMSKKPTDYFESTGLPQNFLFITTDKKVLDKSAEAVGLRKKADTSFFARTIGQLALVLPIFGTEAGIGMALGSLSGTPFMDSVGLLGGAIVGAISGYRINNRVYDKIYASVKRTEKQYKNMLSTSTLTMALPDRGILINNLSFYVQKSLELSKDRRQELDILLPDICQALHAEATARKVMQRIEALENRAEGLKKSAGIQISNDAKELSSLEETLSKEKTVANAAIAKTRKRYEDHVAQIEFDNVQQSLENTKRSMQNFIANNVVVSESFAATLSIVSDSLSQAHTLRNSTAIAMFQKDFANAIQAVSSNVNSVDRQTAKEVYDALVVKYKDKIPRLRLFDDIQR